MGRTYYRSDSACHINIDKLAVRGMVGGCGCLLCPFNNKGGDLMARKCTICEHPQVEAINKALVEGMSLSEIVSLFPGITKSALHRHKESHLPTTLSKAKEAQQIVQGDTVMAELKRCFKRVNLLFDACDRWLRDADDPSRYDLGPRAEDVKVTYLEPGQDGGRPKKAPISHLLAKIEGAGYQVIGWESKHADPRELILKTANRLQGQVELLAKLMGQLPPEKILVQIAPTIDRVVLILRQEVRDPEALQRISQRLLQEAGNEGGIIDV